MSFPCYVPSITRICATRIFYNSKEKKKLFRLSVKCSVNKKPEDLHVFLAKGHKPDVNSTERQAKIIYFSYSNCL
jgi:hypothetical protein